MPFKLASDWKDVLKRAWSARILYVACLLTGFEAVLHFFGMSLPLAQWQLALLTFSVTSGALAARIIAQKGLVG